MQGSSFFQTAYLTGAGAIADGFCRLGCRRQAAADASAMAGWRIFDRVRKPGRQFARRRRKDWPHSRLRE